MPRERSRRDQRIRAARVFTKIVEAVAVRVRVIGGLSLQHLLRGKMQHLPHRERNAGDAKRARAFPLMIVVGDGDCYFVNSKIEWNGGCSSITNVHTQPGWSGDNGH